MASSTPSIELAASMLRDHNRYLDSIRSTSHSDPLREHNATHYFTGLPGAVSDVKGKMVYSKSPTGLELAWEFEVEMEDNWYDVVISAHNASRIFSVIDWVRDSPAPADYSWTSSEDVRHTPLHETTESLEWTGRLPISKHGLGATYLILPWGISDPDRGKRAPVADLDELDRTASPYGWHAIPIANVPAGLIRANSSNSPFRRVFSSLYNFTSTLGNNVFAQENWTASEDRDYVSKYRPSSPTLDFIYPLAPVARESPEERLEEARKHVNASITQIFYTINKYHDLLYR